MRQSVVLSLLALTASASIAAPAPTEHPVKAELLADTTGLTDGQPFRLGVRFELQPKWHVYWINPGDAGLPTSVQFKAPEGFRVESLRWPIPAAWNQPGNIVGYGYEKSLLLGSKVEAPATLPEGPVQIRADVRWLACKEVCIPGRADLKLDLSKSASPAPANAELFDEWEKRLPMMASSTESPLIAKSTGTFPPGEAKATFMVLLEWKDAPSEVSWFPGADPALRVDSMSQKTEGRSTQITFTGSILPGLELGSDSLDSLIVYTTPDGERRGVTVPVRLRGEIPDGSP